MRALSPPPLALPAVRRRNTRAATAQERRRRLRSCVRSETTPSRRSSFLCGGPPCPPSEDATLEQRPTKSVDEGFALAFVLKRPLQDARAFSAAARPARRPMTQHAVSARAGLQTRPRRSPAC